MEKITLEELMNIIHAEANKDNCKSMKDHAKSLKGTFEEKMAELKEAEKAGLEVLDELLNGLVNVFGIEVSENELKEAREEVQKTFKKELCELKNAIEAEEIKKINKNNMHISQSNLNKMGACPASTDHGIKSITKPIIKSNIAVQKEDVVNNPSHYRGENGLEVLDVIKAFGLKDNFYLANAAKYILRAGKKDPQKNIEDLQKAVFYLNAEINDLMNKK